MAGSIEVVQKILQETIAPGISDIRERLSRVEVEIKRLDEKIDSGLARLDQRIDNLKSEMVSGFLRQSERMNYLEDNFRTAIEITERLAALEGLASR